jgi:hypothetical protein
VNETAHVLDLVGFVVGVFAVMGIIVLAAHLWSPSRNPRGGQAGPPDRPPRDAAPSSEAPSRTPAPGTTPPTGAEPSAGAAPSAGAGPDAGSSPAASPGESTPPETRALLTQEVAPALGQVSNGSAPSLASGAAEPATPASGNGKHQVTNGADRTAGWRPDPDHGEDLLRYWDGLRWTDHFARRVSS